MKKIIILALVGITSIGLTSSVQAKDVALSICEFTASDQKSKLRTFVNANNLKIRRIYRTLECNGMGILKFAASKGSVEVGTYYINKIPRSQLKKVIGELEDLSPDLYEVALKRLE